MRAAAALLATVVSLVLAAPAFAADNGEGLLGETDDKVITFFSLGVVVFFALLVTLLSAVQGWLDKRKSERQALELRRRIGW
jgi:hypothetical protein